MMPRIEVHDTVFPAELYHQLWLLISTLQWVEGWHTNSKISYTIENAELVKGGKYNRDDISEKVKNDAIEKAWAVLQEKILGPRKLLRCYANRMLIGMEGYPHTDTRKENNEDLTCVAYFCGPDWVPEWGGETVVFREGEIIRSVVPKMNRVFVFPSNMLHAARSVTRICTRPRVTMMFKCT